eukprot:Lithocolla_globosa_v1_NODE_4240_length_1478_cov_34.277895.p2 type:complete len:101 gc:universal NODE_4240_length_1478_cov_34.277895:986-1288(+)
MTDFNTNGAVSAKIIKVIKVKFNVSSSHSHLVIRSVTLFCNHNGFSNNFRQQIFFNGQAPVLCLPTIVSARLAYPMHKGTVKAELPLETQSASGPLIQFY